MKLVLHLEGSGSRDRSMLKGSTVIVVVQVQAKADVAVGLWLGSCRRPLPPRVLRVG